MGRIGYNVNVKAIADWQYLLEHVRKLQPATMLLMDDANLEFAKLAHKNSPNTKIIIRHSDPHENDMWLKGFNTLSGIISAWHNENTIYDAPYIYHELLTEPAFDDSNIDEFVTILVLIADYAAGNQVHLAMPGFATGSYTSNQLAAAKWDRLFYTLNAHRDYHILSLHEYGSVVLPLNVNSPGEWILDPMQAQPSHWTHSIPTERVDGHYPELYAMLRLNWLNLRCKELGIAPLPIVLTEFGWDDIPSLHTVRKLDGSTIDVIKALAAIYGVSDGFIDLNGINTLTRVFSAFYPHLRASEVAISQLAWWDSVAPANVLGACLFTWSENARWQQYNFAHLTDFHGMLEKMKSEGYPVPVTTTTFIQTKAAYQQFEHGFMIWREDTAAIYVLYNTGKLAIYPANQYNFFAENTQKAPAGFVAPVFGFGKVHANFSDVRTGLGYAIKSETSYTAAITSLSGVVTSITLPTGKTAFFSDSRWDYTQPAPENEPSPPSNGSKPLWTITQEDKLVIVDFLNKLRDYIQTL